MTTTAARPAPRSDGAHALLADGTTVRIRPARSADREGLLRMYREMSPEHLRMRFFGVNLRTAERSARKICAADRPGERALLAVLGAGGGADGSEDGSEGGSEGGGASEHVLGAAEFHRNEPDGDTADLGIAVAENWHHRGVGTLLLEHLAHAARADGIRAFTADALAQNAPLFQLVADIGLRTTRHFEGTEVHCTIELDPDEAYLSAVDARGSRADAASLEPLLRPRSAAVIGVGRSRDSVGRAILTNLRDHGFTGELSAVSRHDATIAGVPCYRSVADLPTAPELAVLTVPAPAVPEAAEQCGKRGVRALVAITSGLDDVQGAALLDTCRTHGMRLVGPDCLGVANTEHGVDLDATFAAAAPAPGTAGVAVQSGGVGIVLRDRLSRLGIGVSSFVSLGDKYDVSGNDLLQWWEHDGRTTMALLHLESFGNPRAFSRTARRLARKMPVLTVDAGRSDAGRRGARPSPGHHPSSSASRAPSEWHTAAMATPTVTRRALFTQAGVIATRSLSELTATAALLHAQPLPAGSRVAVVGNAGGAAVLAADACAEAGLTVPELPAALVDQLADVLPDGSGLTNPVDTTAAVTVDQLGRCLDLLTDHGAVDAVLVTLVPTAIPAAAGNHPATALLPPSGSRARPVAAVLPDQEAGVQLLRDPDGRAVPCYADPTAAASALSHVAGYARWRARPAGTVPELDGIDAATADTAAALVEDFLDRNPEGGWADPRLCAALLDVYGIRQPPWAWVTDEDEAAAAARALGGRVALKAHWPGLVHKSDVGVVRLDLAGAGPVRAAYRELRDRFGAMMTGALVQPMAPRGTELVAGVVQDGVFGPLILFGLGGTVTELLADHTARLAPLTDGDVHDLITASLCAPLLFGYRSGRAADLAGLEQLLHRLSRMACDLPQLAQADLNPVLARPESITPLDVRIRLLPRTARDPYLRRLRERPHPGGAV